MPLDPRRLVKQSVLDGWADELVALRRDLIEGKPVDPSSLLALTREIRLSAGGYGYDQRST